MRPVDLTPEQQRRDRSGSRTGPLAYIVVAALVALLAGVVVLIASSNQISERESELTGLQAREQVAMARADRLAPYAEFQQVKLQRTTTVAQLADSRFDWPRILRQLSLIMPKYVVVGKLIGVAGQGAGEGDSGGASLASEIKGPSLSIEGCAVNQKRVAALIAALEQIDGVTRVGLESAGTQDKESSSSAGEGGCRLVEFTVAVAFDAAPISPGASAGEAAAPAAAPAEGEAESATETSSTETESGATETTVSETTTVTPPAN